MSTFLRFDFCPTTIQVSLQSYPTTTILASPLVISTAGSPLPGCAPPIAAVDVVVVDEARPLPSVPSEREEPLRTSTNKIATCNI